MCHNHTVTQVLCNYCTIAGKPERIVRYSRMRSTPYARPHRRPHRNAAEKFLYPFHMDTGAAERFQNWGGTLVAPSLFLPSLFPNPMPPTPFPSDTLPSLPFLPSPRPHKALLGGLGCAVSSPSGLGRARRKNRFCVYLR